MKIPGAPRKRGYRESFNEGEKPFFVKSLSKYTHFPESRDKVC